MSQMQKIKEWVVKSSKIYIRFRMRSGRGSTFTAEMTSFLDNATRAGAITILLKTYANIVLPWWVFPIIYITQKTIEYHIGRWDEKHGTWRYENEINAGLNPWNDKVWESLQEIQKKICEEKPSELPTEASQSK